MQGQPGQDRSLRRRHRRLPQLQIFRRHARRPGVAAAAAASLLQRGRLLRRRGGRGRRRLFVRRLRRRRRLLRIRRPSTSPTAETEEPPKGPQKALREVAIHGRSWFDFGHALSKRAHRHERIVVFYGPEQWPANAGCGTYPPACPSGSPRLERSDCCPQYDTARS